MATGIMGPHCLQAKRSYCHTPIHMHAYIYV
ncbi:hypothetical protein TorRG33x02_340660 [Trema orientale]|uniref:Uncharacterized protein n=1 Tax=Trema orientale TaxID=63057 RepID=A0A2P5AUT7_TREOI|nr:hypothetical protein TorRG33x02_340660 [Trema orientale]